MAFTDRASGSRLAPLAAALVLLVVLAGADPAQAGRGGKAEPPPPNIVLIMTDDQPASTLSPLTMPKLYERMVGPGTSFSDYIATTPLCCPSRATTITGQYGHNNGVLRNDYALLRGKNNVLPRWLQKAGYKTAHIGKFMNGFGRFEDGQRAVAPGWDLWFTLFERKRYYDWQASKNGRTVTYGSDDDDHQTEVLSRRAGTWTRRLVRRKAPFYLQLDYYAPHGSPGRDRRCLAGPVPSPRDEGRFATAPAPSPPSYNEADISDKPAFIRSLPLLSDEVGERIERRWRCTLESLRGVDRGIGRVFRKIERHGELDRTVFVFSSDNGYYFGEHRINRGKLFPYEENLRMPLTILVPPAYRDGAPAVSTVDAPAANIDLAPTLLELAGAEPCVRPRRCRTLDGRSLLPLLDGRGGWPANRGLAIEIGDCQYRGVRARGQVYFEYADGPLETTGRCRPHEVEHYDLGADPFQLDNLYPAPRRSAAGAIQRQLQEQTAALGECAGIRGRDPAPESGEYCE